MRLSAKCVVVASAFSLLLTAGAQAQQMTLPPPVKIVPGGPAPKRSLVGIWQPYSGFEGIQPNGGQAIFSDGKHEPPYTSAGMEAFKKNKPSNGITEVGPGEENDPGHACDPLGFPRANLFEVRATEFIQTPKKMVILYQYDKLWRTVWTDGRALPKDPEPRWYGYSTGKWADDYTFVTTTVAMDDRTWLDNAGRPHSDEMTVEETFHRIDSDNMEISVKITDPKFYSKPFLAMDKMKMKRIPDNTDPLEMMCVPSELNAYNQRHANLGNKK
ncbi:MAG: hypothetical protein ABL967_01845 [Bryobacteraceae bacterium]